MVVVMVVHGQVPFIEYYFTQSVNFMDLLYHRQSLIIVVVVVVVAQRRLIPILINGKEKKERLGRRIGVLRR